MEGLRENLVGYGPTDFSSPDPEKDVLTGVEKLVLWLPDLFKTYPESREMMVGKQADDASESDSDADAAGPEPLTPDMVCNTCGFERWKGWGQSRCFDCSESSRLCAVNEFMFKSLLEVDMRKIPADTPPEEPALASSSSKEELPKPKQGKKPAKPVRKAVK
jgi:hypothetical protein